MLKAKLLTICFFLIIFVAAVDAAELSHGKSFTITGSGFGVRSVQTDIFDNCSGSSPRNLWSDSNDYVYSTPMRGVSLPHDNITKYAVGDNSGGSWYGNTWLSHNTTGLSFPTNVFVMSYRRLDPNWYFDGGDDNFKWFTVSSAGSTFSTPYWYHDNTGQKNRLTANWDNSFYSSGGLGNLNTHYSGTQGGSGDSANDPWYGWVKMEYRIGLGSSGQILKYLTNNKYYQNLTGLNTFDGGGNDVSVAIGVYPRQDTQSTQYNYQADIVLVVGNDAFKRVILSDSPKYTSSKLVEFQPIVSWSNTSIQITGNIGAIPNGTAYLHVFLNASDTPVSTVAVTIGGGNTGTNTSSPVPPTNLRIITQ